MKKLVLFTFLLISSITSKAQILTPSEATKYIKEQVDCCNFNKLEVFEISEEGIIRFKEPNYREKEVDLKSLSPKKTLDDGDYYGFGYLKLSTGSDGSWVIVDGMGVFERLVLKFRSNKIAVNVIKALEFLQKTAKMAVEISIFTASAEKGDSYSMLWLASIYFEGKDNKNGLKWLEKAVAKNNPTAIYTLADYLYHGYFVEQNYELAMDYYDKAARIGDKGIVKLFERAANEKHSEAMFMMGYIYQNGFGVTKNYETAKYWLKKAIEYDFEYAKTYIKEAEKLWTKGLESN